MFLQLIVNGLVLGAGYALLAVGLYLLTLSSGFLNISFACCYLAGAYALYTGIVLWEVGPLASIALSLVVASALAVLLDRTLFMHFRRRRASREVQLIAAFGCIVVTEGVIALIFGSDAKTVQTAAIDPGTRVLGTTISAAQIGMLLAAVAGIVAAVASLRVRQCGRALVAVNSDAELASACGVPVEMARAWIATWSGICAGTAASAFAHESGLRPLMGFEGVLVALVAVIAMGHTGLWGVASAGVLIGLLQSLTISVVPVEWKDVSVYILLLVFVAVRSRVKARSIVAST